MISLSGSLFLVRAAMLPSTTPEINATKNCHAAKLCRHSKRIEDRRFNLSAGLCGKRRNHRAANCSGIKKNLLPDRLIQIKALFQNASHLI